MKIGRLLLGAVLVGLVAGAWQPPPTVDGADVDAVSPVRAAASAVPAAASPWKVRRLTTTAVDQSPSIAVDPGGVAHIAFARVGAEPGIYVANNRGGPWVSGFVGPGNVPSLALGPAGAARVAYEAAGTTGGIGFAIAEGGRWTRTQVTTNASDGTVSLAIDANDRAHIAFVRYGSTPGVYVASNSGGSWAITRVTSSVPASWPALALDAQGHSHLVVTRRSSPAGVLYATDRTGRWVVSQITAIEDGASESSFDAPALAVDTRGVAHVAFARRFSEDAGLLVLTQTGSGWIRELVASGTFAHPTVAIVPDGSVRIAFHCIEGELDAHHCGVYQASSRGGLWVSTRLGSGGDGGLTIDPAGRVHAAANADGSGIQYRTNVPGTWTASRVTTNLEDSCPSIATAPDGSVRIGVARFGASAGSRLMSNRSGSWATGGPPVVAGAGCPVVAVDRAGRTHLVAATCERAIDEIPPELPCSIVYAVDGPAGWTRTLLSSTSDGDIAIAVDRAGRPHIAFGTFGTDKLVYATNASGAWQFSTVATRTLRPHPSIAVDGHDVVHLAFNDGASAFELSDIVYATNRTSSWVRTVVARAVSQPAVLAAGPSGRVHILVERSTATGDDLYDSNSTSSGGWVTTKVASGADGGTPSIALDSAGVAHVAFATDAAVVYATNGGGSWRTMRVASSASEPRIAVDARGNVHLAFIRASVGLYYGVLSSSSASATGPAMTVAATREATSGSNPLRARSA